MDENKFWEIIERIGWEHLCSSNLSEEKPYEVGKLLLKTALPTLGLLHEFERVFSSKSAELSKKLTSWEEEGRPWGRLAAPTPNLRNFHLGDDNFGDLVAHIIGCGREEYEATLKDPEKALSRAHSHNFAESFSYCIPYEQDYDPIEKKLARAMDSLGYWVQRMISDGYGEDDREVAIRIQEMATLEVEANNISMDEALQKTRLWVQEQVIAAHERQVDELKTELSQAEKMLRAAQNSFQTQK